MRVSELARNLPEAELAGVQKRAQRGSGDRRSVAADAEDEEEKDGNERVSPSLEPYY